MKPDSDQNTVTATANDETVEQPVAHSDNVKQQISDIWHGWAIGMYTTEQAFKLVGNIAIK